MDKKEYEDLAIIAEILARLSYDQEISNEDIDKLYDIANYFKTKEKHEHVDI